MSEILWLVFEDSGFRNFRITLDEDTPPEGIELTSIKGVVHEVTAWEYDDVKTPCEFSQYLRFYIKWDECCHIDFGDEESPGYIHMCGADSWSKHVRLMNELFAWASKRIPMRF